MSEKAELIAGEFEKRYAEQSGVTVEWLRQYRKVVPCECEADECEGWAMVPLDAPYDGGVK